MDGEQASKVANELRRVTPLSKYLAMVLFILMPFIGGYIGYTYAPAKVLEVEKIIVRKPTDSTPSQIEESVVQEFRQ